MTESPEFGNQLRLQFADGEGLCNGIFALDPPGSLIGALITIEKDQAPAHCLRRQIMVAFGLFGDLPEERVSILSVDQGVLQFSEIDKGLPQQLYSLNLPETQ
ncbi:hypothetical protein [uncultured Roseobacter sp.]|uniref:hypothetical protein n=1 Tax=uncultured Roseobacter sp. TaxID=114847 RepID=UPI0026325ECE|nr:hypothetical protein [uncultured Roseobacter sp.]